MTYCKDCRTEFMVEADDPCPRCGRYLGGARMGQRVEVERLAQAEQLAAPETAARLSADSAPKDAPPCPAEERQAPLDAVADECAPLFMRLALIAVLVIVLGSLLFPDAGLRTWVKWTTGATLTVMLLAWLVKMRQRVAQTWRSAGGSTASASLAQTAQLTEEKKTTLDVVAEWCASLLLRLGLLILLTKVLLAKVLPPLALKQLVVIMVIVMVVIAILSEFSRRAAEDRARAAQQTPSPQPAAPVLTDAPPRPAQQGQTPLDAAEDEDVPPSRMRRAMLALRALLAWLVAEASPNAPPLLMTRGMLLVLLTIPAGIGFGLLVFYQYQGRHPAAPLLWFLYLSVFVPPVCCLLTPLDDLEALLRGHPWFWKLWLLWAVLATGVFLWAMIDPHAFRIFLSVFGGGYY